MICNIEHVVKTISYYNVRRAYTACSYCVVTTMAPSHWASFWNPCMSAIRCDGHNEDLVARSSGHFPFVRTGRPVLPVTVCKKMNAAI